MNRNLYIGVTAIFAFLILLNSFYILDQRQAAIILQFGDFVKEENKAGLKFKVPFIQDVLLFDNRVQNLIADTTEVIASDQKTMRVDAFTKYKIVDPLQFYKRAKDEKGFKLRLSPILDSSLRQVLGEAEFSTLLSPERGKMMLKIKDIVNAQALDFGVDIVDVRIMRADLPDKSREAVYDRMKSDRAKEAKEIRAQGAEQAQKIMATADKDKIVTIAEARKKAEIMRGEGDATAIKSFAGSFGRDPEFFDFYRSMQAYRKSIGKDSTRMIISPDSEFMKYFKSLR